VGTAGDRPSAGQAGAHAGGGTVIPLGDPDLAYPPGKGPAAGPPDDAAGEPDAEAERMAVLAALERGEIDVDSAMMRLDTLQEERP